MIRIILLILFSSVAFAQVTIIPGLYPENLQSQTNYIKNKSCWKNTANITASGGSFSRNTSSGLDNGTDCQWQASASAQTLTWGVFQMDRKLANGNCEARFKFIGDASGYKAYVKVNSVQTTTDLQLTNSSVSPRTISIPFACGNQPLPVQIVVQSTIASPASIKIAEVYAGELTTLGTASGQASFYGGMTIPGNTNGCFFQETTSSGPTNWVDLGTGSGCSAWTVQNGTGTVAAQATNDHRIVLNNMPAGEYDFELTGAFETSVSGVCNWRLTDGTIFGASQTIYSGTGGNMAWPTLRFHMSYSTPGSRTFKLQAADTHAGACMWDAGTNLVDAAWKIFRFPSASDQVLKVDCGITGDCVNNFSAAVGSGGAVTQENVDFINGNCTNPSTGTYTCTFNTGFFSTTPNCWIINNGPSQMDITSLSSSAITYELRNGAGTLANGAAGVACMRQGTDMKPAINAPLVIGSITTNSTVLERIERAFSSPSCTATPCTISSQTGSWLTSISRSGTGSYTANIASGMFSSAPTCFVASSASQVDINGAPTTSAFSFETRNGAGTLADASLISLLCMGPR